MLYRVLLLFECAAAAVRERCIRQRNYDSQHVQLPTYVIKLALTGLESEMLVQEVHAARVSTGLATENCRTLGLAV
jgi:hypothetical protein